MKSTEQQDIRQLIKRLANNVATEELIGFVAEHEGMLRSCRIFLSTGNGANSFPGWFREECRQQKLDPDRFISEIKRLLQIFRADDTEDSELYAVLGLDPGATLTEVKKAFRRLSRLYHPDSSVSGKGDSARFIAVCQAYKAILAKEQGWLPGKRDTASSGPWIYRKKQGATTEQKKRNIVLIASLSAILLVASMLAPFIYKRHVMLSQFAASPEVSEQEAGPKKPSVSSDDSVSGVEQPDKRRSGEKTERSAGTRQVAQGPDSVRRDMVPLHDADQVAPIQGVDSSLQPGTHPADIARQKQEKNTSSTPLADHGGYEGASASFPHGQSVAAFHPDPQGTQITPSRATHQDDGKRELYQRKATSPEPKRIAQQKKTIPLSFSTVKTGGKTVAPSTEAGPPAGKARNVVTEKIPASENKPGGQALSPARSHNTQAELANELLRLRLLSFLEGYTTSYEHKDLGAFASYFTEDAVENGASFQSRRRDYEKLFARAKTISFSIIPDSWNQIESIVNLRGRFTAEFRYSNSNDVVLHGKIILLLEDKVDSLKVKELSYWFDK